ncbi:DUF1957 domain-containing protein [candidate division KSB1 bacterium]|nr:DUF1957 domain-containing protein [candidate division KSB1 bacterium]
MPSRRVGQFALLLHAHLPYVLAHGRWPHGTDWLCEAAAETYIPLLDVLYELVQAGISPRITIDISPVLAEQLADTAFQQEFMSYLNAKIATARANQRQFSIEHAPHLEALAQYWEKFYQHTLRQFTDHYHGDLIRPFRELFAQDHIDLITCAATHGYLPLLSQDTSIQAQIKLAVKVHRRLFGQAPRGIWLPECAYRPRYTWAAPVASALGQFPYLRKGVDEFLSENDLHFFIVDAATLKGGKPIGVYLERFQGLQQLWEQFQHAGMATPEIPEKSHFEPYHVCSGNNTNAPVTVFGRDPQTAVQVWSGTTGYPGDGWYLEFHKKYFPGGLRYWRVTDTRLDLELKDYYQPEKVAGRLYENSVHFVAQIQKNLKAYQQQTGCSGMLVAPFDAELFGHWWFEGPQFLKNILYQIAANPELELITGTEKIRQVPVAPRIHLPESSWGEGGFHFIWLNQETAWMWSQIYEAEIRLQMLTRTLNFHTDSQLNHILKQAARELLLGQSSDWPFLITTKAAPDYAATRFQEHLNAFNRLASLAEKHHQGESVPALEWEFFETCQQRDPLFPELNLAWFRTLEHPAAT